MQQRLTLSLQNRATIICPIFDTETQVRACAILREKVYMGQRTAVRAGCQACMSAGKCPVEVTIRKMIYNAEFAETDPLGSETPTQVKLPAIILESISPIIVPDSQLNRFGTSSDQRLLIQTSRERIEKQLASAPRSLRAAPRMAGSGERKRAALKTPVVAKPIDASIAHAAATGDLAAAINS